MSLRLVRRKGTECWYLRGTVRGIPCYESTGTDDERAAEEIRIRRERALLDQSIHGKKATATFLEAAVAYMQAGGSSRFLGEEVEPGRWSGLIGHFWTTRLSAIGQAELDTAARRLYQNASPATLNRQVYTPFIAVWNYAAAANLTDARDWRRPRAPKGTRHSSRTLRAGTRPTTYDQAAAFVARMSVAPAIAMTILFYTGLRPIELFAMQADDADPDGRWFVVRSSKTGEPRGVPMHRVLVPMVRKLKARGGHLVRTPSGAPYAVTEDGGGQMKTAITGARKRSGIPDISPYTARHTVSTQLVVNGVHPHIKDQILGHAVDSMSRHYTAVPQPALIEAIDTLPVPEAWATAPWMTDPFGEADAANPAHARGRADDVIRLRREGKTYDEIASALSLSRVTVWGVLRDSGMLRVRGKRPERAPDVQPSECVD